VRGGPCPPARPARKPCGVRASPLRARRRCRALAFRAPLRLHCSTTHLARRQRGRRRQDRHRQGDTGRDRAARHQRRAERVRSVLFFFFRAEQQCATRTMCHAFARRACVSRRRQVDGARARLDAGRLPGGESTREARQVERNGKSVRASSGERCGPTDVFTPLFFPSTKHHHGRRPGRRRLVRPGRVAPGGSRAPGGGQEGAG
jgi:hypothetical protein